VAREDVLVTDFSSLKWQTQLFRLFHSFFLELRTVYGRLAAHSTQADPRETGKLSPMIVLKKNRFLGMKKKQSFFFSIFL